MATGASTQRNGAMAPPRQSVSGLDVDLVGVVYELGPDVAMVRDPFHEIEGRIGGVVDGCLVRARAAGQLGGRLLDSCLDLPVIAAEVVGGVSKPGRDCDDLSEQPVVGLGDLHMVSECRGQLGQSRRQSFTPLPRPPMGRAGRGALHPFSRGPYPRSLLADLLDGA